MVQQYLNHSKEILSSDISEFKENVRTGIGHISLFGYQNRYDLRKGFPLLTTKKMPFKMIAHELIWFMHGEHNIKYLVDNNVHIWDDNAFDYNLKNLVKDGIFSEEFKKHSDGWFKAKEEYIKRIKEDSEFSEKWGSLGPVYGTQWVHWPKYLPVSVNVDGKPCEIDGKPVQLYIKDKNGIDQLSNLINAIKKNPTAKRHMLTAWNPAEVNDMALPPCHTLFQINANEGKMDLQLYQRSCDMFLGVPFNIASYAMLTEIIAQQTGHEARGFVHTFGDVHFYCGAGARKDWYHANIQKLKCEVKDANSPEQYDFIRSWINLNAPAEEHGKEGQDHVTAILEQLARTPKILPTLKISNKHFSELTIDDFVLEGYYENNPHPTIKRAMAV